MAILLVALGTGSASPAMAGLNEEFQQQENKKEEASKKNKAYKAKDEIKRKEFCAIVSSKGQFIGPNPAYGSKQVIYFVDKAGAVFSTANYDCRRVVGYTNKEKIQRISGWAYVYKVDGKKLFTVTKQTIGDYSNIKKEQVASLR